LLHWTAFISVVPNSPNSFTEAVNEKKLTAYSAHYLNYNFFTQFPIPVPYEDIMQSSNQNVPVFYHDS